MRRNFIRLLAACAVLAITSQSGSAAAALVTNGGFETGDFTGWTLSGNTANTGIATFPTNSGDFSAFLGAITAQGAGTLSQDVATEIGRLYTLDFFLANNAGAPNHFAASLGNAGIALNDADPFGFTEFDVSFVPTSTTTTVQFVFDNDAGQFFLDDVSVNVPEPAGLTLAAIGLGLVGLRRLRRADATIA